MIVYLKRESLKAREREIVSAGDRQSESQLRRAKSGAFSSPALTRSRSRGISSSRLAAAAAIVLTSACAPLHWQKDGAGPAALQHDLAECRDQARLRARSEAPLFGQPPPAPVGMDSRGRAVTGRAGRYDTDRALIEHDLTRACMGERGYELAPAQAR